MRTTCARKTNLEPSGDRVNTVMFRADSDSSQKLSSVKVFHPPGSEDNITPHFAKHSEFSYFLYTWISPTVANQT